MVHSEIRSILRRHVAELERSLEVYRLLLQEAEREKAKNEPQEEQTVVQSDRSAGP